MSLSPSVSGNSLSGHLRLRCEAREDGTPFIAEQSFRAPVHLSKSHMDEDALIVTIVNPTAGFFDGDHLETNVSIEKNARLVLSTPSASRVYRARSGKVAASYQTFSVGENAFLEWIPEPFIPHAGARYLQHTKIQLHPTASLLFFDWISPGRVARDEIFAYDHLRWELDLEVAGKLVARERYGLRPGDHSLEALRVKFPAAHYLAVYATGKMTTQWPAEALDALNDENTYLGHGPLPDGFFIIRAICRDSLSARALLEKLRPLLYTAAGEKPPKLGRIFL